MNMTKNDFGDNFSWGVSTAAYQIEGGHNKDGKGNSIWDEFTKKKNKIANNENGNIACDFFNRYASDISLLHAMNIPNFRFSISWSRILPDGIGTVNEKGIDFYNRVIDFCLELGIVPWVTLYHWDLPQALEEKGGWTNREIIHWFSNFVEVCVKRFGDRVTHWMVLNEPMVFTGAGYFLGVHAPGKKGLVNFLAAAHHAAMCQAQGGRIIRALHSNHQIGTTFSFSHIEAIKPIPKNELAAKRVDALLNRLFIEPLMGLGYPVNDLPFLNRIEKFIQQDDWQQLPFEMDFIGVQNYTREIVKYDYFIPFIHANIVKATKRKVECTEMNWEVYPEAIYHILKKVNEYKKVKEIIVTENGAAFKDSLIMGEINDVKRSDYLKDHLAQVARAKKEGINVNGYFVWTFLDNFEWAEGYRPRFGLVHIDFATQKRTIKSSGLWYQSFICGEQYSDTVFLKEVSNIAKAV